MKKVVRQISTTLLLLDILLLVTTVLLMQFGFELFDFYEIHEILGFVFIGLVVIHIIIFRKSLLNLIQNRKA